MSLPADLPSRQQAGQEDFDRLLRLGSRYCINFGWLVERDETRVVHGNYATVYQGILQPEGRRIAIRIIRQWKEEDDGRKVCS